MFLHSILLLLPLLVVSSGTASGDFQHQAPSMVSKCQPDIVVNPLPSQTCATTCLGRTNEIPEHKVQALTILTISPTQQNIYATVDSSCVLFHGRTATARSKILARGRHIPGELPCNVTGGRLQPIRCKLKIIDEGALANYRSLDLLTLLVASPDTEPPGKPTDAPRVPDQGLPDYAISSTATLCFAVPRRTLLSFLFLEPYFHACTLC